MIYGDIDSEGFIGRGKFDIENKNDGQTHIVYSQNS